MTQKKTMTKAEEYSFSPQVGVPRHCSMAQVWYPNGKNLACIEPTENPEAATRMAEKISDLLNNDPSELLKEAVSLLERCGNHLDPVHQLHDDVKHFITKHSGRV